MSNGTWIIEGGYPNAGKKLKLLTTLELMRLKKHAPETVLISILGREVKAKECDNGHRFGYVAFGVETTDALQSLGWL